MQAAATNTRTFRTFLLMSQLQAKEIGARIALARNERGMTQEEVADVATFSKRSLQDYEAGHTLPYRHMREISRLLNRPVEWFLHGDQPDEAASLESRLAELAAAVGELVTQFGEAVASSLSRLEAIERQLALLNERVPPRDGGTNVSVGNGR